MFIICQGFSEGITLTTFGESYFWNRGFGYNKTNHTLSYSIINNSIFLQKKDFCVNNVVN